MLKRIEEESQINSKSLWENSTIKCLSIVKIYEIHFVSRVKSMKNKKINHYAYIKDLVNMIHQTHSKTHIHTQIWTHKIIMKNFNQVTFLSSNFKWISWSRKKDIFKNDNLQRQKILQNMNDFLGIIAIFFWG